MHSLREMVTHLVLVTLGVLIALSFEGVGSWREQRALVREARANILRARCKITRSAALQGCPAAVGRPKGLRYQRPPVILQRALS